MAASGQYESGGNPPGTTPATGTINGALIGIDLGGTNIKGALVTPDGKILTKREIPTQAQQGPAAVAARIGQVIAALREGLTLTDGVMAVGIGVPGAVDPLGKNVLFAPNLHWRNVPLADLLQPAVNLPLFFDNDANAAALGEYYYGAGKGSRNMVMVTVGTGIGGGLILNGELYRGSGGSAGEIGHTIVLPDGPRCNCGRRGCLETLTAAPAIIRRAREAIKKGTETSLAGKDALEAKDVFKAALDGDSLAREIICQVAYYLGIGIANLLNTFNPDLVVIGGGVSKAGEALLGPVREMALNTALEVPSNTVQIIQAQLGNDAGSLGAAALALEGMKRRS